MSLWAPFKQPRRDDGLVDVHVCPVDSDGHVVGGHELTPHCICRPRRDRYEPHLLVHWDPERGGYNA